MARVYSYNLEALVNSIIPQPIRDAMEKLNWNAFGIYEVVKEEMQRERRRQLKRGAKELGGQRDEAGGEIVNQRMLYKDLPTGNWYRIAAAPNAGEFFKCQPWVSTTADLEKMFLCKDEVEVIVTNRSGVIHGCEETPSASKAGYQTFGRELPRRFRPELLTRPDRGAE